MNKTYNIEQKDIQFNFYKFPLKLLKSIPNEIEIQTEFIKQEESSSSIMGVHYEPIKKNHKNLSKTELGKTIILKIEYIK